MATIRSKGVRAMIYIDDLLVVAPTQQRACEQTLMIVTLLQKLGFVVNQEKSILEPLQSLEYLGLVNDTMRMELRLPLDTVEKFKKECRHALNQQVISVRGMVHLLGKMSAAIPAILEAPLHYRALHGLPIGQ